MTRIAAKDLAPYNIRVNSVSPAYIGPGFMWGRQIELQAKANSVYYDKDPKVVKEQMIGATPLKRYGSTDEVIGPVTFLLSDDASYLTGVDIQIVKFFYFYNFPSVNILLCTYILRYRREESIKWNIFYV